MAGVASILIYAMFWLARGFQPLDQDESGQDVLEYVLTIAGVSVAIVAVLLVGFSGIIPRILDTMCPAIDPLGDGSCLIR